MSSCSFCLEETDDLYTTTKGNLGCEQCIAHLAECCKCHVILEKGGGQWWDDGLAYCFNCTRGVPQCLWCERPALERATSDKDDRVICVYCAERFPHCEHCGHLIHGDCLTYQHRVYCRKCADQFPLCVDCGEAITQGGDCPNCGGPPRVCGGCQNPFADRWMVFNDTWYCTSCYWRACGRCRFCQETKPENGDNRCDGCRESVVTGMNVARDLLDEVQWFCREELGLQCRRPYELRLAQSGKSIPKLHTDVYTLSLSAVGLWVPREREMWVTQGYPIWFTSVILAHEHAHAWQSDHCPPQSQDLLEGFASWVEWHVALNLGYETFADNMFKFGCPIYGRGLRRCLQLENQVGPAGVVEKMRSMRAFSLWTSFWAMLDEP